MNAEAKTRVRWAVASMGCAVCVFGAVLWHEMRASPRTPIPVGPGSTQVPPLPIPALPIAPPDPTGKASLVGTAASVSPKPIRLKLFATSPGTSPREGTAILGTDQKNPQTYCAGSVLASGARIEEIFRDHIVLRFNGAQTKLYREGTSQATEATADLATTVGGPGFADKPVDTHPSSQEDFVDIVRSRLVFDGEKVSGFEISGGRRRDKLAALGLESGDVIRSIEGRPVTKDSDWQRIAKALARGGSIVLGVERQGSLMSISMDAGQLNQSEVATTLPPLPPSS